MSFDDLRTGAVITNPFLWAHEADAGHLDGTKRRPTAVGLRLPRDGRPDAILLFPITTKQSAPDRFAVEISLAEKRRGGLEEDLRLWMVLDEFNEDAAGGSLHLLPGPVRGYLSKAFFLPLMKRVISRRANVRAVLRR